MRQVERAVVHQSEADVEVAPAAPEFELGLVDVGDFDHQSLGSSSNSVERWRGSCDRHNLSGTPCSTAYSAGRAEFQEGVFTREHIAARAVGQIVAPHRRLANDGAIVLNLLDLLQMVGSEAVFAIAIAREIGC
jgi:hypothetical protein